MRDRTIRPWYDKPLAWVNKFIFKKKSPSICILSGGRHEYEWDYYYAKRSE